MTAVLTLTDLRLRLGGIAALDGPSFSVMPGEVLGLIGPNGAGKTTLIDCICGFHPRASGSIRLGIAEILGEPPHRVARRGVGRSFQSGALFPALSVRDNLAVAANASGRANAASVDALLAELDLIAVAAAMPAALTNSERRRVQLARSVAGRPRLVLLDEPAAGLSPAEAEGLTSAIRGIAARLSAAVLLVEHNVGFVTRLADRIAVLHFGRVIADGKPGDVVRDPAVIAAYLGPAS